MKIIIDRNKHIKALDLKVALEIKHKIVKENSEDTELECPRTKIFVLDLGPDGLGPFIILVSSSSSEERYRLICDNLEIVIDGLTSYL